MSWGYGQYGSLGVTKPMATTITNVPLAVTAPPTGLSTIQASTQYGQVCALQGSGLWCWGNNNYGEVGVTSPSAVYTPTGVYASTKGFSVGGTHTCVITPSDGVQCWGQNNMGQLGDGTTNDSKGLPVSVTGLAAGVSAIAGGWDHTCALLTTGAVQCWGTNIDGELGTGAATSGATSTPVNVVGLPSDVVAITAGGNSTCALTSGGGVLCWGWNYYGQLGDNTIYSRPKPVNVVGLSSGVASLSLGGSHSCAVMAAGGVRCWGDNGFGQLGDGTTTERHTPVAVSGL